MRTAPPTPRSLYAVYCADKAANLPGNIVLPRGTVLTSTSSVLTLTKVNGSGHVGGTRCLFSLSSKIIRVSCLPLTRICRHIIVAALVTVNTYVKFCRNSGAGLLRSVRDLQPALFVTIPHLLGHICSGVVTKINGASKVDGFLFGCTCRAGTTGLRDSNAFSR